MNQDALFSEVITEDWLRESGFKWHQFDRQPEKQWLLWIGGLEGATFSSSEDLGIEVCSGAYNGTDHSDWYCWVRCDSSHRYHRFIHLRHIKSRHELIQIIEALTGLPWNPANVWHGALCTEKRSEYLRKEKDRLDKAIHSGQYPWSESEKDPDRGRPLREHMDAAIKAGTAR